MSEPRITSKIVTFDKICLHCNQVTTFNILKTEWNRWQVKGEFIQDVFPHLSISERETMISGTHPKCWKEMFPEEEY